MSRIAASPMLTVSSTRAGRVIGMAFVIYLHTVRDGGDKILVCPSMHHVARFTGSWLEHAIAVAVAVTCP
jgi:hypothetical protein